MRKLFISAAALLLCAINVFAQEGAWSLSVGNEAVTQYMWRGQAVGETPTIVPTVTLDFEKDDFAFEAGYCSITELQGAHYLEMDFWASASYKGFTFTAMEQGLGNNLGIGGYDDNLELTLEYELPFEYLPATISWNTFVAGDDFNLDGSRAFSSYVELNLPYEINDLSLCLTAGAVPYRSEVMYGVESGFRFVNLSFQAAYNFTIGENFGLPLYIQDTYNPIIGKNYVILGCALSYTFDL